MATENVDEVHIAILDDRKDFATTVERGISPYLPDGWIVLHCPLMQSPEDYALWITNNKVSLLLVDYLLHENPAIKGKTVNYKGHKVAQAIRKKFPEFPIVIISRADVDQDLSNNASLVEDVLAKDAILRKPTLYLPRIVRMAQRFIESNRELLAKLSRLSEKVAKGKASPKDLEQIGAIQLSLGITATEVSGRDVALTKLEQALTVFESLRTDIDQFLTKEHKGRSKR